MEQGERAGRPHAVHVAVRAVRCALAAAAIPGDGSGGRGSDVVKTQQNVGCCTHTTRYRIFEAVPIVLIPSQRFHERPVDLKGGGDLAVFPTATGGWRGAWGVV